MSKWREAWSAASLLEWWDGRVASTGLAAAAATPAVLAMLDQHSAAVRDALLVDTAAGPVAAMEALVLGAAGLIMAPPLAHLGAYLRGVLDQAHENGWRPPDGEHRTHDWWHGADWVSLRVTAICALARTHVSQP